MVNLCLFQFGDVFEEGLPSVLVDQSKPLDQRGIPLDARIQLSQCIVICAACSLLLNAHGACRCCCCRNSKSLFSTVGGACMHVLLQRFGAQLSLLDCRVKVQRGKTAC